MPTYRNESSETVWVLDYTNNQVKFAPGEEKETLKILDDANLTKINDEPYYNTLIDENTLTLATSATSASLNIDPSSSYIRIIPITSNILLSSIKIFINDWNNIPGITVNELITLTNRGKIEKLYFSNGPGTICIKEIK